MTPHDRARDFLGKWQTCMMPGPDRVQVALEAVIRATIEECAQAVEDLPKKNPLMWDPLVTDTIAAEIRARSNA